MTVEEVLYQIEEECCLSCGCLALPHGFCEICVEDINNAIVDGSDLDDSLAQYILSDAKLRATKIIHGDMPF